MFVYLWNTKSSLPEHWDQLTAGRPVPNVIILLTCHVLINGTSFSAQSRCTSDIYKLLFPLCNVWSWCARTEADWVWEGSSLAVRVQQSGWCLPGEQFRVLGNSPTRQQLRLYMNLMKTLPLSPLFVSFFISTTHLSRSQQTARAWISIRLYSHHFEV